MSVLFKALRKAADDNRSSEAEVAVPVIGAPLQPERRRISPVVLLIVLLAVAGAGFFVAFPDLTDELVAAATGESQPVRPALVATQPPSPVPSEQSDAVPEPPDASMATAEALPAEPPVVADPVAAGPQSLLPQHSPAEAAPAGRVIGTVEPSPPRRETADGSVGARAPVVLNRTPPAEELADRRKAADPDGRLQVSAPQPAQRSSPAPASVAPPPSIARLQENAYRALSDGNLEGALRQYQQILQRERGNKSALLGKAVVLQRLGLKNSAQEAYEELLAVDPGNRTAMANLLAVLSETQPQAALAQLQRLEQSNPTSAPIVAQIGMLHAQQGDLATAAQRLQLATALAPENAVYKLNLAIIYDRAGRSADAVVMYDQSLRQATASNEPLPMALDDVRRRLTYLAGRN